MPARRVLLALLLLIAAASGCRRAAEPVKESFLNVPASREDALDLMRAIEDEGIAQAWPPPVVRQVRSGMLNRLLAAGLSQAEVEAWINASDPSGALQNNTRGNE